jgi:hypothetical protein
LDEFITTFNKLIMEHYDRLIKNGFDTFLFEINNQYKNRVPPFFKSLTPATILLQKAFHLMNEKKIVAFDKKINN